VGTLSWLSDRRVVRLCQVGIGLVFVWAALAKLGNLEAFAGQVHNFRLLPIASENIVAMALPWIELVAALALIFDVRARAGAVVLTFLLAVFTVAIILAVARGLDFECGCFGTADASRVGLSKILQNAGMLAVAFLGTRQPR